MAEQFLTQHRFEQFEDKFDKFVERLNERDLKVEARLTALETNQSHAAWIATWLSGIVATIVAAAILSWKALIGR